MMMNLPSSYLGFGDNDGLRVHGDHRLRVLPVLAPSDHGEYHRNQAKDLSNDLGNRGRKEAIADGAEICDVRRHRFSTIAEPSIGACAMDILIKFFNVLTDLGQDGSKDEWEEDHDGTATSREEHGTAAANAAADVSDIVVAQCFTRAADADGEHTDNYHETANHDNRAKHGVTFVRDCDLGVSACRAEQVVHAIRRPFFAGFCTAGGTGRAGPGRIRIRVIAPFAARAADFDACRRLHLGLFVRG